jgi:hypothetical protein
MDLTSPLQKDEEIKMSLAKYITTNVCKSAYDWAWIWYCDECQDHGTAESAEEAHYYARCHAEWKTLIPLDEEGNADPKNYDEDCVYERFANLTPEDKIITLEEVGELCGLYIVSVKINKTFDWVYVYEKETYEDETPHDLGDVDEALRIIDFLGLPKAE